MPWRRGWMSRPGRWRRAGAVVVTILLGLALVEAFSYALITLASPRLDQPIRTTRAIYADQTAEIRRLINPDTPRVLIPDSILGWRYRAGWRDRLVMTNEAGLRSAREYSNTPPPGTKRVAAFGDSFVFGSEVSWEDSWPALLEASDSSLEVLNYGVGGYGVDQAFLRFLTEGERLSPSVILICFSTDDLRRGVNVYRRFVRPEGPPLFKPRFVRLPTGELQLVPNPVSGHADYARILDDPATVRDIGRLDAWYEPLVYENPAHDLLASVRLATAAWTRFALKYLRQDRLFSNDVFQTESEAFQLHVSLLRAFHDSVVARGRQAHIVFLPDQESLARSLAGLRTIYAPLADTLAQMGLPVVDAAVAFADRGGLPAVPSWYMPGGHLSRAGNQVVATWLAHRLTSQSTR